MKPVDLETWNRRAVFEHFRDYEIPFFSITANLDVTRLYQFCKRHELSFSLATIFYSLRAANEIREFRIRLIDGRPFEFDRVHGSQTILHEDESISFSVLEDRDDVFKFVADSRAVLEEYRRLKSLDTGNERLDLLYYSIIPWISFTSVSNAMRLDERQTIPRLVFGRVFEEAGRKKIPHAIEIHHAIADGLHAGRYFMKLQENFDSTDF
ncbi:MAG: chloramphenicol acetyltransferase [Acidobacteria bacterium]|nr:chloramphenicol acetyltransferase [Acidobacteriota bacterium]